MDRYDIAVRIKAGGHMYWSVTDRNNTGETVARCSDPHMAKRIMDLLNEDEKRYG